MKHHRPLTIINLLASTIHHEPPTHQPAFPTTSSRFHRFHSSGSAWSWHLLNINRSSIPWRSWWRDSSKSWRWFPWAVLGRRYVGEWIFTRVNGSELILMIYILSNFRFELIKGITGWCLTNWCLADVVVQLNSRPLKLIFGYRMFDERLLAVDHYWGNSWFTGINLELRFDHE